MDVILDRGSTPLTSINKKDSLRVLFIYVIIRPNRLHSTQSLFWSRFSRHHDSLIRVACGSQMQILLESPFFFML